MLIESKHIRPVILITKKDLLSESEEADLLDWQAVYQQIGYSVEFVSARELGDFEFLKQHFKDCVSIVAGQSGVGKSSLLNAVNPSLELQTDDISTSLGRGKHTTRHVELVEAGGGLVADTPGFSTLDLTDISAEELSDCFPEISEREPGCKFRGCYHYKEPKCAVKQAVEDGEIAEQRYAHYIRFWMKLIHESRGINMTKIAPSILSADFSKLGEEIKDVERAGADYIHVDVMDGHFVPNITIGPLIAESIKPHTTLPLDVHLMIENPDQYIPAFAEAGASIITVHQETAPHLHRTVQLIKQHGVKAGVVINPATPAEMIRDILHEIDLVLIMTVNPGFGGQSFIPSTIHKIEQVARWRNADGLSFEIEVDGGVKAETAKSCTDAGADVLVAGSAIFKHVDRQQAIDAIRRSVQV